MVLGAEELSQAIARLKAVWRGSGSGPDRPSSLLVMLDFDRTITTADRCDGCGTLHNFRLHQRSATSHGVLEMDSEFKLKQQEVAPAPLAQRLSGAPRQSHAAQITKHYLPLERDPLIPPEQRAVRFFPQCFSATFCPRFFPLACQCRIFLSSHAARYS